MKSVTFLLLLSAALIGASCLRGASRPDGPSIYHLISEKDASSLVGGELTLNKCCSDCSWCFPQDSCVGVLEGDCANHTQGVKQNPPSDQGCVITSVGVLCNSTAGDPIPLCMLVYQCEWDDELQACLDTGPVVGTQYGYQACRPACS